MIQTPFLSSPPPTPPVASWRSLTYGIVALAPSLFISRLGWVGMKVTDTALLGHIGTHTYNGNLARMGSEGLDAQE